MWFFQDNVYVETEEGLKNCRLIAVHGGLQQEKPVDEQLKLLKSRDTAISKVEHLSGRKTIWDIPKVFRPGPHELLSSPTPHPATPFPFFLSGSLLCGYFDANWSWSSAQCPTQSQGPRGDVGDRSYPQPFKGESRRNARDHIQMLMII